MDVTVVRADARDLADQLAAGAVPVSLVYIDPPFAAERQFHMTAAARSDAGALAYSDRWNGLDTYLRFMDEVLTRVHAALADDGSLLLHCDHRAAPYLAVACDRIFGLGDRSVRGRPGFRNELVWSYGLGGSSARCYPKKHDTILWYTKGDTWFFDPPRVPASSRRMAGQTKKAPDVLAVPSINNMARERTGYPTQKPLALLTMLVQAHARSGDLVVDLFSGSGTTAAAAFRTGRRAVVGDDGELAFRYTVERLRADGAAVDARPGGRLLDG